MHLALLLHCALGLAPLRPGAAPGGLRVLRRPALGHSAISLCEAEDAGALAARKRLKAERLALEAEKADLEAAQLALKAQKLKLEELSRRPKQEEVELPPMAASAAAPAAVEAEAGEASATNASGLFDSGILNNFPGLKLEANRSQAEGPPVLMPIADAALGSALKRMGALEDPSLNKLSDAQLTTLRETVFDQQSFYVTEAERSYLGVILRGNLRSTPEEAFRSVQEKLEAQPALDGVQLLLLNDPMPLTLQQLQAGEERRPVFLALSGPTRMQQPIPLFLLALTSLLFTAFTTLGYALSSYLLSGEDGRLIEMLQNGDPEPLINAAPIAAGLLAIQISHELAHFVQAQRLGIKQAVPVIVPSLQLGYFGGVTRLLDFPKSRTALFDYALAGPALGGALSLALYLVGLTLSVGLPPPTGDMPVLPTGLLESSLLLGTFAQAIIPDLTSSATVQLHPLAVVGFTGVLVNALQLLPVGRLDGGRVAHAVFGASAGVLSTTCLLLIGFSSLFGDNPIALFFGLFVVLFQRAPDLPTKNELSGVDAPRQWMAAAAGLMLLLTILPCPVDPSTLSQGIRDFPTI